MFFYNNFFFLIDFIQDIIYIDLHETINNETGKCMTKNLTMVQMAKELNISRQVISAVINNNFNTVRVSDANKARIKSYLDQRGYVQSKSALQMKNGADTDSVGILYCGEFLHFSHLTLALSILTEAIENKYGTVEITGLAPYEIHKGIRDQVAKGVRKLIWIHANTPKYENINANKLYPLLKRMDKIVIYNFDPSTTKWNNEYIEQGIDLVGFDRVQSYRNAAELFASCGYSKIALDEVYYGEQHGLPGIDSMLEVFKQQGFEYHGLYDPKRSADPLEKKIPWLTENLIKLYHEHDVRCAFIRNDLMAAEIMHCLISQGIRVPEDMALIGFGETAYSKLLPAPLTTFKHPVKKMCETALKLIEEKSTGSGKSFVFDNEFIIRKSHSK